MELKSRSFTSKEPHVAREPQVADPWYRPTFSWPRSYMEVSGQLHALAAFLPKKAPGTHWIGGWVGPEPVWTTWRRENSWPYRDSSHDSSVVQSVASRYTDCANLAPIYQMYAAETYVLIRIWKTVSTI
jgi:hypothetical protein